MIVIWDFDWSFVNENTDTWVIKSLSCGPAKATLRDEGNTLQWTALMDLCLSKLSEEGVDEASVARCLGTLPYFPEMVEAAKLSRRSDDIKMHIVSDANEYYIETILAQLGIRDCFESIHTNGAKWEHGRLRVWPHHSNKDCERCPENMCKSRIVGQILEQWPRSTPSEKVIYVGDGGGDFCPVAYALGEGDVAFVRDDPNVPQARGLVRRLKRSGVLPRASIEYWKTGDDVLSKLLRFV